MNEGIYGNLLKYSLQGVWASKMVAGRGTKKRLNGECRFFDSLVGDGLQENIN